MKLLRVKSLLLLAFILLSAQTVLAGGAPSPTFNWTGPYVGLHLGYGWGNADTNFYPLPDAGTFGMSPAKLSPSPNGVQGGIQAGYNYQMGCFVAGIEADFSGSGMSDTKTFSPIIGTSGAPIPGGGALTSHESINWFGTLRPRLGFTVTPSVLVYGTGGLAYGNVSSSANTDLRPLLPIVYPASSSSTQVGWTAGGGVEWAISKCWTVKAEYLYMDLGSQSAVGNPNMPLSPAIQVGYKWNTTANILSFGVNYKF
jgi:outer membrane immunogenic protein